MISFASFRIEQTRLVANSRVVMAGVALAATYFDPSQPSNLPQIAYLLLSLYLPYATALAIVRSLGGRPAIPTEIIEHVLDLVTFTALIYMTEGLTSPFFPLFTYALLVAHLRWRWRGTIATAIAAILVFLSKLLEPEPDVGYVLVRCTYLAVVALLIAWIGGRQEAFQNKIARIAARPSPSYGSQQGSLGPLLAYAAGVIDAPCVLLVWAAAQESVLKILRWQEGTLDSHQMPLGLTQPILAQEIAGQPVLVVKRGNRSTVLVSGPDGVRPIDAEVLDEGFAQSYVPGSVLVLPIKREGGIAHLMLAGKSDFSLDDLLIGEVVAGHVSSHLAELSLLDQLREGAVMNERIRLARDLHDGLLQSLTAARLQIETVDQLLGTDPERGAERLAQVQASIERDQRSLREFINQLKPAVWEPGSPLRRISDEVENLSQMLSDRWNVNIIWTVRPADLSVAPDVIYQMRRLIEEATANATRHGRGTNIAVAISVGPRGLDLQITDDGQGFQPSSQPEPMPRNLHDRVESLGGTLDINSSPGKTTLNIVFPVAHLGSQHAYSSDHS
jgi:signal transduction histidine kinase